MYIKNDQSKVITVRGDITECGQKAKKNVERNGWRVVKFKVVRLR
jgi:hypothetical protein